MILERLRAETAPLHRELEDKVQIEEATKSAATYRELLARFFGFHLAMEGILEQAFTAADGWYNVGERLKTGWLREDLDQLGVPSSELNRVPQAAALPSGTGPAYGFGCAYVMEGSTLGGRHISAMLERKGNQALPTRFFKSYGAEVGARWKEFCARLEAFAEAHLDLQTEIVEGAKDTFRCFTKWLH